MAAKFDLYAEVTQSIIDSIEAGTPAWRKPWTGDTVGAAFPLRSNGEPYSGINVLMLWLAAQSKGYTAAHWFTYKQAKDAGGQVRKGEKSSTVVKYRTFEREDKETGEERRLPYLKAYRVFNAEQIDGLPEEYHAKPVEAAQDLGTKADPMLNEFFAATGADIRTSDEPKAYYKPSEDYIHMPPIEAFYNGNAFYSVLAHECCHWTGHKSRLDRFSRFKDKKDYAFEELIAEIGSAMVCARLGLTSDFEQSGAYVKNWLRALNDDKRLIFKAASEAQKAADLLMDAANREEQREAA